MTELKRTRPTIDPLTKPFWEAAIKHQLVIQFCSACERLQHPPALRCFVCNRVDSIGWQAVFGNATLVSWTQVHQGLVYGFKEVTPYFNLLVELNDQPGLMMLSDTASSPSLGWKPRAGEPMQVWFEDLDGFTLPQFGPIGGFT